jgi:hypothetical protein
MSTSEIQTLIAHLPVDVESDLVRYGVTVVDMDIECISLHAIDEDESEVVSLDGCEVIELPVEVVSYDRPVDTWAELVPTRAPSYKKGGRHEQPIAR